MILLYLHQYFKFPSESGGTRSFDLASSFVQSGIDVHVITTTSDEKFRSNRRWSLYKQCEISVHYLFLPYSNDLPYFKRILAFVKFVWFATFKVLSFNCDLVLASSTPLTIGIPAIINKWLQRTPFVFEVRDVWPEAVIAVGAITNPLAKKILFFLERLIYANAEAIIPLSEDMKSSIVKRFPDVVLNKKICVIENIAEIYRFQKGFVNGRNLLETKLGFAPRFTVLYAGTFGRVNGIEYVIRLARRTLPLDSTLVYVLIGDGAYKSVVKDLAIDENVIGRNVFLCDSVSKEELPQLYHEANMGSSFVIPIRELWANSANKFFDTLAAGKPILINYEGWQKNIISKYNVGYVLPETLSDLEVLRFVDYTKNDTLIKAQQIHSLELATKEYSLEAASEKYINVFKSIVYV